MAKNAIDEYSNEQLDELAKNVSKKFDMLISGVCNVKVDNKKVLLSKVKNKIVKTLQAGYSLGKIARTISDEVKICKFSSYDIETFCIANKIPYEKRVHKNSAKNENVTETKDLNADQIDPSVSDSVVSTCD